VDVPGDGRGTAVVLSLREQGTDSTALRRRQLAAAVTKRSRPPAVPTAAGVAARADPDGVACSVGPVADLMRELRLKACRARAQGHHHQRWRRLASSGPARPELHRPSAGAGLVGAWGTARAPEGHNAEASAAANRRPNSRSPSTARHLIRFRDVGVRADLTRSRKDTLAGRRVFSRTTAC
jgi:hypothetical protein